MKAPTRQGVLCGDGVAGQQRDGARHLSPWGLCADAELDLRVVCYLLVLIALHRGQGERQLPCSVCPPASRAAATSAISCVASRAHKQVAQRSASSTRTGARGIA